MRQLANDFEQYLDNWSENSTWTNICGWSAWQWLACLLYYSIEEIEIFDYAIRLGWVLRMLEISKSEFGGGCSEDFILTVFIKNYCGNIDQQNQINFKPGEL